MAMASSSGGGNTSRQDRPSSPTRNAVLSPTRSRRTSPVRSTRPRTSVVAPPSAAAALAAARPAASRVGWRPGRRPRPLPPRPAAARDGGAVGSGHPAEPVGDGDRPGRREDEPRRSCPDRVGRTGGGARRRQRPPAARTNRSRRRRLGRRPPPTPLRSRRAAVSAAAVDGRPRTGALRSTTSVQGIHRDGSHARHLGREPAGLLRCTRSPMS